MWILARRFLILIAELLRRVSVGQTALFLLHLILVVYLSFSTPLLVRYLLSAGHVSQEVPLEFTFHTCDAELHGVCSFPEATALMEPEMVELMPGYYHSFALDLVVYDTPQNRGLGIFIATLQPKNDEYRTLAVLHKSVPVLKSSFGGRSVLSTAFVLARNVAFLPLYLCSFFDDRLPDSDVISVKFSKYFYEKSENRTRSVLVQLQSKFIQLSSAKLKIHAHVGMLRYAVHEYPLISYLTFLTLSGAFYFTFFALYWAWRGYFLFEDVQQTARR